MVVCSGAGVRSIYIFTFIYTLAERIAASNGEEKGRKEKHTLDTHSGHPVVRKWNGAMGNSGEGRRLDRRGRKPGEYQGAGSRGAGVAQRGSGGSGRPTPPHHSPGVVGEWR